MNKQKSKTKKKSAPKIKELNAEQRKLALLKQKHCDAVAMHIVGKLIDGTVSENVFIESIKYLNQSYYQDIIEERAISKMCGYPICSGIIPNMSSQRYHISTKVNKVYDVTERKNYCSNYCYKASVHIKDQILTSPLWFRDQEEIPEFKLLSKNETGEPGEEIDQGIIKIQKEETENFKSISDFVTDSVKELPDDILHEENLKNDSVSMETITEKENISEIDTNNKDLFNVDDILEDDSFLSKFKNTTLADILKQNNEFLNCTQPEDETEELPTKKNKGPGKNKSKIITEKSNNKTFKTPIQFNASAKNEIKFLSSDKVDDKFCVKNMDKGIDKDNKNIRIIDTNEGDPLENENNPLKIDEVKTIKKTVKFKENTENASTETKSLSTKKILKFTQENINLELENDKIIDRKEKNKKTVRFNENKFNFIVDEEEKIESKTSLPMKGILKCTDTNYQNKENTDEVNVKKKEIIKTNDTSWNNPIIEHQQIIIKENTNTNKTSKINKSSPAFLSAKRLSVSGNSNKSQVVPKEKFEKRLRHCLEEWLTLESMIFLYGEETVKKTVSEKTFQNHLNNKIMNQETIGKDKKLEMIYKKLNLMELRDNKFDEDVKCIEKKPLPEFEQLKKQAETMNLRVKAFYSGCYEIHEDDDTESVQNDDLVDTDIPAVLPLVHSNDIMPMRHKIFLSSMNRIIPQVCQVLKQSPNYLFGDIKKLVDTFEFSSKNVLFTTHEWPVITILLIKLLSIRDDELSNCLKTDDAQTYLTAILENLNIDRTELDTILFNAAEFESILTDILLKYDEKH